MSRIRQVFPRDEVAHLWAHKAQDSARDASGNFYFNGPALYSYGSHFVIAYILGDECGPELSGRVLWNGATYSNTTSKMQSIAWRALTRQQRETMFTMPGSIGMGRNVEPARIERALQEKRLPDVAELLLATIVESIAALQSKRYGGGPFESCLSEARKAETLARAMYARAGRKYPLPLVESRPVSSDKAEWAAWIKLFAAGKMRRDYAAAMKAAKDYMAKAEKNAADSLPGFPYFKHGDGCEWEARNIVAGTYDVAQRAIREIQSAQKLYFALNGKPGPATLKKPAARMAQLAEVFKARRQEFEDAEKRNRVIYEIREALKTHHRSRVHMNPSFYRAFADMEALATRAIECGMNDALYFPLAERLARIGAAVSAKRAATEARRELELAESYAEKFPSDAIRHAGNVKLKVDFVARLSIAPAFRSRILAEMEPIATKARELAASAKAAILAREAETLRAWLAGESNARPSYAAGTFARIRGDVVETTRGANVPISHACRLSRMYAVCVKRGGASWPDGSGPMVGHYRVNNIGADGSLIIGCHEFSAEEAKRLHALLQECAACAELTE